MSMLFFFFFQAEDGIRDPLVTGVQTCALPISRGGAGRSGRRGGDVTNSTPFRREGVSRAPLPCSIPVGGWGFGMDPPRSEERRVGKECRCGRGGGASKEITDKTTQGHAEGSEG